MRKKTSEEYIETIYLLEKRDGCAKTGKISLEMRIRPASVTEMLRKLQDEKYINYEPYRGAKLTERGKKVAHELMKTHRIIAYFLQIIGIEEVTADIDACQIEHHVSSKTIKRLARFIEFIKVAHNEPKWLELFKNYLNTKDVKTLLL